MAGLGGVAPPPGLRADAEAVLREAAAVFGGELPYAEYTFLALFADAGRGGLEHATSSVLLAPRTTFHPRKSYENFMGLLAHEFFHVWNATRMRPVELWKYDYERENHSELLWVVEGFTAYYDDLICRRAGVLSAARYLDLLAGHLKGMRSSPGRLVQSMQEASFDAWIRLYRPDENTRNATQNYYVHGALVGFLLDARIRARSDGARSLDDALRSLWESTWLKDRGYTRDDVVSCLDEAAGCDLADYVDELVSGPFDPDFGVALDLFGLKLQASDRPSPYIGVQLRAGEVYLAAVIESSPAWKAGLAPGDEVLAVGGLRVQPQSFKAVFEARADIGVELDVLLSRRGEIQTRSVVPAANPSKGCKIVSVDEPSAPQLRHRMDWLRAEEISGDPG